MSLAATITINKRHGLHAAFIFLMCACMKKLMYFKVLKGMTLTLDTVDKRCLEPHPKYPGEVVAGDSIRSLTRALCILITAVISYMRTEGLVP